MRSGKWWPWAAAWGLAAATAAVLLRAGIRLAGAGSLPPAETRDWAVAIFALGASVLAAFRWASKKTHDPPARLATERISTAKGLLAMAVEEQWKNEARFRDWEKRPLIQVRWRVPVDPRVPSHSGAIKNPPQTASSAEIGELAEKFRACEPRRLVILGGPGTGKTTLAVRLLLELLATREGREDEPVPVTIPVAQWDTDRYPRLQAWLSAQLYQDYPGLQWLGVTGVRQLVDLDHVLPILDGLDELPELAQATVIKCLNDSLGRDGQLILTSRTTEYIDAVGEGRTLEAAAVLEPLPVTPRAAADYLTRSLQPHQPGQPAWARALKVLRADSGSMLAEVAATPLGLWLLRAVYIEGDADPDELTDPVRFPTPDKLRAHLLDHLIAAFLPPDGGQDQAKSLGLSRGYQADDVKRWLAFLARHLSNQPSQHDPNHHGARDFEWWRVAATTGKVFTPLKTGLAVWLAVCLMFALVFGLVFGLVDVLAGGFVGYLAAGLVFGLVLGLVFGLVHGLAAGLTIGIRARRIADDRPGYAKLRTPPGPERFRSKLTAGLTAGSTSGLTAGLVSGLGLGFGFGFSGLLMVGFVRGIMAGLAAGILGAPAFGLAFGFVSGLVRWIETPTPAAQTATPRESLQADRTLNLTRIAAGYVAFGLPYWLASALLVDQIEYRLAFGLAGGLVGALMGGLAYGRHRAWLAYTWATWRLSREGVLPRRLMPFLDDMHRLGLLRAVGRIYQFRHAELQDHLAAAYRRAG